MRDILFRGKRLDNGEWVEGGFWETKYNPLVSNSKDFFIREESYYWDKNEYEVDCRTIGQYTGLTDKNGKKIFEGDIVKYTRTKMYAPTCSFHNQDLVSLHLILWDSSVSAFVSQHYTIAERRIIGKGNANLYDDRAKENTIEVIGNIHDNPELLEEE